MFNRDLQVKLVKKEKTAPTTPDVKETETEGKTAIIAASLVKGISLGVVGVGLYVILDTGRQVAVAIATKA